MAMIMDQWVIQGIGVIALLFFIFSFQAKTRSKILYLHIIVLAYLSEAF